nr:MAG TPA: hypothetical protein [Caudoviricetes sp.]
MQCSLGYRSAVPTVERFFRFLHCSYSYSFLHLSCGARRCREPCYAYFDYAPFASFIYALSV